MGDGRKLRGLWFSDLFHVFDSEVGLEPTCVYLDLCSNLLHFMPPNTNWFKPLSRFKD
jgi:hypothetical protein